MGVYPGLIDMDHKPCQPRFVAVGHGLGEFQKSRVLLVRGEPFKAQVCEMAEGDDAADGHGCVGLHGAFGVHPVPPLYGPPAHGVGGLRLDQNPIEVGAFGIDVIGLSSDAQIVLSLARRFGRRCRREPDLRGVRVASGANIFNQFSPIPQPTRDNFRYPVGKGEDGTPSPLLKPPLAFRWTNGSAAPF